MDLHSQLRQLTENGTAAAQAAARELRQEYLTVVRRHATPAPGDAERIRQLMDALSLPLEVVEADIQALKDDAADSELLKTRPEILRNKAAGGGALKAHDAETMKVMEELASKRLLLVIAYRNLESREGHANDAEHRMRARRRERPDLFST